jgi:recombination protein RecT
MCTTESLLKTETAFKKINEVLSNATESQKFLILARVEISKNERLRQSKAETVLASLVKAASLRLFINTGDAYLVPYWDNNLKCYVCQFQIGYQGMLKLLYRGGLKSIKANVVYSNDEFEFVDGTEASIRHVRALGNRGDFKCAYCIANINGESIIEIMDKNEIDVIRSMSKKANKEDAPWVAFYDEMAKKTVIRRIFKKLPQENFDVDAVSALRDDENLLETANTNVERQELPNLNKSEAIAAIL